jgi:hypothetical protein
MCPPLSTSCPDKLDASRLVRIIGNPGVVPLDASQEVPGNPQTRHASNSDSVVGGCMSAPLRILYIASIVRGPPYFPYSIFIGLEALSLHLS